jgi:type IV secretion system protein VirB1
MLTTLTALMAVCAPAVHPVTLRALIFVESAGNPNAVSVNRPQKLAGAGVATAGLINRQPQSRAEAVVLAQELLRQGISTSIGLAQINIEQLPALRLSLDELLDPCTNLRAAEQILIACDRAQDTTPTIGVARLHRTLSCYNAGNYSTGFTNGYVARVVRTAARVHRTVSPIQH